MRRAPLPFCIHQHRYLVHAARHSSGAIVCAQRSGRTPIPNQTSGPPRLARAPSGCAHGAARPQERETASVRASVVFAPTIFGYRRRSRRVQIDIVPFRVLIVWVSRSIETPFLTLARATGDRSDPLSTPASVLAEQRRLRPRVSLTLGALMARRFIPDIPGAGGA